MSCLTFGLMSLSFIDLEILQQSGSSETSWYHLT
ncbi:hypothetical protein GLYMA_03G151650v4 [Glycine max]|nr:hypothetical protein GLYMA_03G151650v4 [Glycine max]KAH1070128.1 hypothetical protein GYH30_007306 [Glycine max]